jgi:hypothetical protein
MRDRPRARIAALLIRSDLQNPGCLQENHKEATGVLLCENFVKRYAHHMTAR